MLFPFIATVVLGFLIYKLLVPKSNKNFWKQHGISEIDTSAVVTTADILLGRKTMYETDGYVYSKMGSQKFCGVWELGAPAIVVKDLDLIKKILIKDFDHFVDRRIFFHEKDGILSESLPSLRGEEWRGVRTSVSPTFTTGKIRRLMGFFNEVGLEWTDELRRQAKQNNGSIVIEPLSKTNDYTIDVIALAVFGVRAGTVKNPNSEFSKMASLFTTFGTLQMLRFNFRFRFPTLAKWFGVESFSRKASDYFGAILSHGLKQRMTGEVKGDDYLQILVELRKGQLKALGSDDLDDFEKDAMLNSGAGEKKQWLTDEILTAQSLVFFFAGFSATSNFITLAMYALALHPEVQEKLRKEVETIVKPDGTFDYDDLGRLEYLEMVVCEVLRKFAPSIRIERTCTKEYRDAESGLFVPKGAIVNIPLDAMHHDPKFFKNADKFDPEHFSAEQKNGRSPYAYMPFGIGPRNCIGMRFALVESKAGLCHILHNFKIERIPKTPTVLKGKPVGMMLIPPDGLELKLVPIEKH